MKAHISSREEVNHVIKSLSGSICVISITDPDQPQVMIECDEKNILRQQFHDLDSIHPKLNEVTYFSSSHAIIIVNFLERNLDRDHIIIHCEAGISRSSAIAAAISHHLRLPNAWKFLRSPYLPNLMVLTILRLELGWKW